MILKIKNNISKKQEEIEHIFGKYLTHIKP